jgi:hypothetical protein
VPVKCYEVVRWEIAGTGHRQNGRGDSELAYR